MGTARQAPLLRLKKGQLLQDTGARSSRVTSFSSCSFRKCVPPYYCIGLHKITSLNFPAYFPLFTHFYPVDFVVFCSLCCFSHIKIHGLCDYKRHDIAASSLSGRIANARCFSRLSSSQAAGFSILSIRWGSFETLEQVYDEHFEKKYGFFRPYVKQVIYRYLDCGILYNGFARVKCEDCNYEYLLAFSCDGLYSGYNGN